MLRSRVPKNLLAPTATDGGGGSAVADPMLESDPSAMSGWMKDLPNLDGTPKKETTDGQTADKTGGSSGIGVSGNAKPADNAAGSDNAAAAASKPSAYAGNKPTEDAAKLEADKAAAAAADKSKSAEKTGDKDDDASKAIADLEKEKFPRHSNQWDDYKKKYGDRFRQTEEKFKTELAVAASKISEYEKQLAEVQAKASASGELPKEVQATIESLKKENDEMSKRLQVVDVTQHPKFQQYFDSKVNAQKTLAKSILGEGTESAAFEEIIALPNGKYKSEKMDEFVSNLPTLQQVRIGAVLNSLDSIEAEKKEEIAKASAHKEQLTGQEKANRENSIKAREKSINDYIASVQKNNPAFKPKEGDAAWNAAVNERIAAAKKILTGEGLKAPDIMKAAFDAAAFPAVLETYKADMAEKDVEITKLGTELKGLKEQISKLTAVQPKLEGGAGGEGGGEGGKTASRPISAGRTPQEAMDSFTEGLWKAAS